MAIFYQAAVKETINGTPTEVVYDLAPGNYYGTCTSQAANQNKAVSVSSDQYFILKKGILLAVKFDADNTYNATTSAPVKLNVNSTGNVQIYAKNSATLEGTNTTYFGRTNYVNYYIYDGTYWVWAGSSSDENSSNPQTLGFGYGTCSTVASTAAKEAILSGYVLMTNGIVAVKFTNEVPANATLNVNNQGAKNIWYKGANITDNIIKAGDLVTFIYDGTRYQLISIDRGTGLPDEVITYEQFKAKSDAEQLAYTGYVSGWPGSGGGSGSGGHTIIDESGTSLAQEPNLQFKGADISDDSTNNTTVVDMSYTEIDYEDWLELTEQEKETGRWDVVGVPGADGTVSFDLMTKLWENPSPTSSFAAQDITGLTTLKDYDLYVATFKLSTTATSYITLIVFDNMMNYANYTHASNTASQGTAARVRGFLVDKSQNKITFEDALYGYTGYVNTTNNTLCIPFAVYGIKTSKTVEIKAIAPEVSTSASKCMMSDGETSVEDAIEEVESTTLAISGFSNAFILQRVGRICFITYNSTAKSLPAGALTFSQTLPERFKPLNTVSAYSDVNSVAKIMLNFSANGGISGYNYGNAVSTTVLCRFGTLSYPALNV